MHHLTTLPLPIKDFMMKTKQLLFFCNMTAGLLLLLPLALAAKGGKKDSTATATPEKRLVLSPQAHLQLSTEAIWGDSVEAIVTVAVPDSCKNQRYLCRIETNTALRLVTIPRYKWAVSADSLKVLSAIPLQIRFAQQSFAASAPVIKIHFQNVDHAAGLTGTATLEIISGPQPIPPKSLITDSSLVSKSVTDSSQILPIAADIDSVATATDSSSFGIFYVALAILLISLFAGLAWLMTWSQRHRFQSITAKTTAAALPHLQQMEPTLAPERNAPNPIVAEEITNENEAAAISATPETISAPSNLPAVIAAEQQFDLAMVLAQLQELKLNLQQIIANQQEVNQRLAQITAAAALEAPRASAQLALFDILNEDSTVRNGESYTNGNGSSALHFPTAEDCNPANLPTAIMSTFTPGEGNSSVLKSSSNLRIFFANAESKAETSEEILLH